MFSLFRVGDRVSKKHTFGMKTILTVKAVQTVAKQDALGRTVIAGRSPNNKECIMI